MVHPDDLFAAVKSAWDASGLVSSVPGGLWQGRPSETTPTPYAVATIEELDPLWTSGAAYLAPFKLTFSIWSMAGVMDAGNIRRTLDGKFNRSMTLTVAHATLVDFRPIPGKVELDDALKDTVDVLATAAAFEVTLQSTTS